GDSVALSGDGNTLAVGAPEEASSAKGIDGNQNDNSMHGAGAVYVYTRNANNWVQQAYVKASNTFPNYQFGYAVGLSANGNALVVSSFDEGNPSRQIDGPQGHGRSGYGALYVYARTVGTWKQTNYLKASNGENGDSLGVSV